MYNVLLNIIVQYRTVYYNMNKYKTMEIACDQNLRLISRYIQF